MSGGVSDVVGDVVRTEVRDRVLVVVIDRPEKKNAIDGAVSRGVAAALDLLESSPDLGAAVLTGAGGVFSAGADLGAISRGEATADPQRGFGGIVERPPAKPVVAAVEGWALGGGLEIVLACDLAVAGRGARFGLPEVTRGLAARGGGALRLPQRVPRSLALEMLLTGDPIDAERAAAAGLLNRVVDDGAALERAVELAARVARNAPLALAATRRVVLESGEWPAAEAFARQRAIFDPVFASDDAKEGAAAFRERRTPQWSGR